LNDAKTIFVSVTKGHWRRQKFWLGGDQNRKILWR